MKHLPFVALLGATTMLVSAGALAQQTPAPGQDDCDRLVLLIEGDPNLAAIMPLEEARRLQQEADTEACVAAIAQVEAQPGGAQPATGQAEGQAGQPDGTIVVEQPAPTITVDQAAPRVSVTQPAPNVTVRQPQPEITVRQPAPVVTVDIPQPEIIVRMPPPEVAVSQPEPTVAVQQPQPEVQLAQPEQPQVQVEQGNQAQVMLAEPQQQANVTVEQAEQPNITYEREEPQVTVNQAEGQPNVTFEQVEGAAPQGQDPAALTAEQQAAAQPGQAEPAEQPAAEQQQAAAQPMAGAEATQPQAGATAGGQAIRVSELIDADVVNAEGEQLGDVKQVMINTADQQAYVIVGHGGFLGLGEKEIALPLNNMWMRDDDLVIRGLTDDQIRQMPAWEQAEGYQEIGADQTTEISTVAE